MVSVDTTIVVTAQRLNLLANNVVLDNLGHFRQARAEKAIEEAETAGGKPDDITEAKELLTEAVDYWDTGDWGLIADYVYDQLEEAWEKAVASY